MIISQADLASYAMMESRNFSTTVEKPSLEVLSESYKNFAKQHNKMAFLSHSHIDCAFAQGLAGMFANHGIWLYIDWKDREMPSHPNSTTAERIREQIKESDYFLFLATENAKSSPWCSWELGYADGIGKYSNIFIIPTKDEKYAYGNEYCALYKSIELSDGSSNSYFIYKNLRESKGALKLPQNLCQRN